MTIFAILLPTPTPAIVAAIEQSYPGEYFSVNETQWLISTRETAADVSNKLGITGKTPATGNAIVFATSSYFGRAPATVWDWIKVKLESSSG